MNSDFQELLEAPNETLDREYKDWLDLATDRIAQANLARHVAALANHGGGVIVFGFRDKDLVSTGSNPFQPYSRDMISGIVKRYLDPSVQCEVVALNSSSGNAHTLIVVPSHGSTPICARADGPHNASGKAQGIRQGTYYIRKVGPESAAISSPLEWGPVIRRCALHDRSALLASIQAALDHSPLRPKPDEELSEWHRVMRNEYVKAAKAAGSSQTSANFAQFSYRIARADNQKLEFKDFRSVVRQLNLEIRDRVNTGWSMFYPFENNPIAAHFATDPLLSDPSREFLQCSLVRNDRDERYFDFWRLSPEGLASLCRPYRNDDHRRDPPPGWQPVEWLSPSHLAQEVGELVRHAQAFAERFGAATAVTFKFEWIGLKGRQLGDRYDLRNPSKVARTDTREIQRDWPIGALANNWPEIVAEVMGPVVRAFTPDVHFDANWVAAQSKNWRPLGSQYP